MFSFEIVENLLICLADAAINHAALLQESIDEFLEDNGPSDHGDDDEIDQTCNVIVYGVDVSTAFTQKLEMELGVDRKYHTYRRGWLCNISNKPCDWKKVLSTISLNAIG
jgi:hypothetical protein